MNNTTFALHPNLEPDQASPAWMNKGDNPQQLTTATLVGLQSVPGLIILYGGAVKKKWAVNSAFMALYAFACVLVCWVLWGYKMSIGDELPVPFLGTPNFALDEKFLFKKAFSGNFPNATMVYFQFAFAAITLILIAGALLGRLNFYAWMLFVPLWLTSSYTIGAFTIWSNNGFLYKLGIIDYSGRFVIHLSSGVAGFTAAYWVGHRLSKDRERFPPNNILLMLTGAGLLWMGWTGFNGGDPYSVNVDASLAVLNTHACTATSLLTWVMLDVYFFGKASIIGTIQGVITGLVCITPAAGFHYWDDSRRDHWLGLHHPSSRGRARMGSNNGGLLRLNSLVHYDDHPQEIQLLQMVDDTMAVLHTHAIAGCLGGILTGLFAEPKLNNLFFNSYGDYVGQFYGFEMGNFKAGFRQKGIQLLGILFIVKLNIVITSIICILVRFVVPLRMSVEDMEIGDEAAHNEEAYMPFGVKVKNLVN
nr:ammonium transporter 3 member 1 [Quercus suber]